MDGAVQSSKVWYNDDQKKKNEKVGVNDRNMMTENPNVNIENDGKVKRKDEMVIKDGSVSTEMNERNE